MAASRQLSLTWMLFIHADAGSIQIDKLIAEFGCVKEYAYVYHEPWAIKPHFHLYLELMDPRSTLQIKEKFNPLLAHPNVDKRPSVEYLLRDSAPEDVVASFNVSKYVNKGGAV